MFSHVEDSLDFRICDICHLDLGTDGIVQHDHLFWSYSGTNLSKECQEFIDNGKDLSNIRGSIAKSIQEFHFVSSGDGYHIRKKCLVTVQASEV